MIYRENKEKKPMMSSMDIMLEAMEKSDFVFYPTGSRAFGFAKKNSDYDFFVTESAEAVNFLGHWGFKTLSDNGHYPASDNIQELRRICRHEVLNIDVQLVIDAKKKSIIQKALAPSLCLSRNNKKFSIELWRAGYDVYNAVKGK